MTKEYDDDEIYHHKNSSTIYAEPKNKKWIGWKDIIKHKELYKKGNHQDQRKITEWI